MTLEIILFLILYFAILMFISYKYTGNYDTSKVGFLAANRNAGLLESSLAAGASWVLGVALFASAGFGYNMGWTGLFWFVVPQALGMIIFAHFSKDCNEKIPNGYTLSSFIDSKFGKEVSILYQVFLSLISLGFIALTFTALTKYLNFIEISNVTLITGIVALGTLMYTLKGGIKTNLITGSVQMIFMIIFCFVLLFIGFSNNGISDLLNGLNGKQNYTSIFDYKLLMTFGIVMALTSVTGIVGNQSYYQKFFSQQNTQHFQLSFVLGSLFFAIVPTILGILGMMAFGGNIEVKDPSTAHLVWMKENIGMVAILMFGFIVLNAAANALDASGNAFGAIVAHDWNKNEDKSVFFSRISIVVIATLGWLISTLNLDITFIFLTYGALRVMLFIATMIAVKYDVLNKFGILLSVIIIAPIVIYLNMKNMRLEGALIGFFLTPIMMILTSYLYNQAKDKYKYKILGDQND
jgi:Na+/proline symporter